MTPTPPDRTEQFVRLLAQHQRRVYSYILTLLPNRADAEDVLQETNAILWSKFDQYEPDTSFGAWACRIAYYEVLAFRRGRKHDPLPLRESFLDVVSDDALARNEQLDERYHAMGECVEKLSARDRDLIERRYTGEMTVEAVAAEVDRPVGGLHKAYQRIRRALMECIDRTLAREEQS
jgi:RNA polymerase sigma-70 factor (ECF subfamily)